MQPSYWIRTDDMIRNGEQPNCPYCGKLMFPIDDHGRFECLCDGYRLANQPRHSHSMAPVQQLPLPPMKKDVTELKTLDDKIKDK